MDYITDLDVIQERLRTYAKFPQYDKIFVNLVSPVVW